MQHFIGDFAFDGEGDLLNLVNGDGAHAGVGHDFFQLAVDLGFIAIELLVNFSWRCVDVHLIFAAENTTESDLACEVLANGGNRDALGAEFSLQTLVVGFQTFGDFRQSCVNFFLGGLCFEFFCFLDLGDIVNQFIEGGFAAGIGAASAHQLPQVHALRHIKTGDGHIVDGDDDFLVLRQRWRGQQQQAEA